MPAWPIVFEETNQTNKQYTCFHCSALAYFFSFCRPFFHFSFPLFTSSFHSLSIGKFISKLFFHFWFSHQMKQAPYFQLLSLWNKSQIYVLILNLSLKFQIGISSCLLNFTSRSTGTQHIQNWTLLFPPRPNPTYFLDFPHSIPGSQFVESFIFAPTISSDFGSSSQTLVSGSIYTLKIMKDPWELLFCGLYLSLLAMLLLKLIFWKYVIIHLKIAILNSLQVIIYEKQFFFPKTKKLLRSVALFFIFANL